MLDLRNIAVFTWILYWSGPLAAYLLSASAGYVDWCVPHLTGCDSISASGRHGWGFFVFKATMLPAAGLTLIYWILCYRWLNLIITPARVDQVILSLGLTGALFLILYVTFLGSDGDTYRNLRRYGTVVFFGFTFLAQLLFSKRIIDADVNSPMVRWKYRMAIFMFWGGLAFAVLANFFEDDDFLQNISEWNFASALTAFPLLTWFLWRHTGFRVEFRRN
ncbi:MAG: hypothetical protein ACFHXK_00455 [bacterium]